MESFRHRKSTSSQFDPLGGGPSIILNHIKISPIYPAVELAHTYIIIIRLWENSGRKKLAKTTSPKPPSQRPEGHIQKTRFIPSSVPAIHYWPQTARIIASLGVCVAQWLTGIDRSGLASTRAVLASTVAALLRSQLLRLEQHQKF